MWTHTTRSQAIGCVEQQQQQSSQVSTTRAGSSGGAPDHNNVSSTNLGVQRTLVFQDSSAKGCPCNDDGQDSRHHLSVLCFNVFAGSPIPYFRNSSPSLDDSDRLRMQVCKIRDMSPDVICLQEMCSDGVERYYRESLQDIYESFYDYSPPESSGLLSLYILYVALAGILSLGLHSVAAEVLGWSYAEIEANTCIMLFTAVFLKSFIVVVLVMRKSAVSGFLGGSIKGSTMILWKREKFTVVYEKDSRGHLVPAEMGTILFKEQQGDWLNLFRRRGYLSARLYFHGMPLWIVNTHLNLGSPAFRQRQIQELAQHCNSLAPTGSVLLVGDFNATPESDEIQLLSTSTGLKDALGEHGVLEPTWAARNSLTLGILIEEDHRCDYVFYRELSDQHVLRNQTCRIVMDTQPWLSDHFGVLLNATLCPRDNNNNNNAVSMMNNNENGKGGGAGACEGALVHDDGK